MSQPSSPSQDEPQGDPWHAFGYITSGTAVYGVLGWLADRWLGTDFLVAVGIVVGAGLGVFMTFARFNTVLPTRGSSSQKPDPSHPEPGPEQD